MRFAAKIRTGVGGDAKLQVYFFIASSEIGMALVCDEVQAEEPGGQAMQTRIDVAAAMAAR